MAESRASRSDSFAGGNASSTTAARMSAPEEKYWYTLGRDSPAAAPTAAGVTALTPLLTSSSVAARRSASRWRTRCCATVGAEIFGIPSFLLWAHAMDQFTRRATKPNDTDFTVSIIADYGVSIIDERSGTDLS